MNRRGSSFLAMVALATLLLPALRVQADELLAHGTGEMFWVARVMPVQVDAPQRGGQTIIRGRAVGGEGRWVNVAQPAERAVSLANRGTELAALFDSGNWMLLWPGGSAMGALPDDGARLLVMASGSDSIWAIGMGGRALATTTAATIPADEQPPGELALYQLERGRWRRETWLPRDITSNDARRTCMTIVGSTPIIAIRRHGSIQTLRWEQDRFEHLEPFGALDVRQIALVHDGRRAILWAAAEAGAGRVYFLGRRWSEPQQLEMNDSPQVGEPRAVAYAGNHFRLLFLRDGKLLEQTFDDDGKAARSEPLSLPATPPSPDTTPNRVLTMAALAVLMIVVLSTLRRGGGDATHPASTAGGVTPAPLALRLVAGLLDALPLLVPCYFIFSDLDLPADDSRAILAATSWPFYTALAAYLLYTVVFELLFGRTLGKMIFGLRVVSLDGSRPTPRAMLARNALRLVDVTMVGIPLILVILSPLRQRVGDIAARTVVVRRKRSAEPSASDNKDAT